MRIYLTEELTRRAIELHDNGISWNIVASVLKTNTRLLRQSIKFYYDHNK